MKRFDIQDFIHFKLKLILKKTLFLVALIYLFIIFASVLLIQNKIYHEKQASVSNILEMTYWYLIRDVGEDGLSTQQTIERISENYNVNIYASFNKEEFELKKSSVCLDGKNIFTHKFSCAIKTINVSDKPYYIIYYIKSSAFIDYAYFFSGVFFIMIFLTYISFFRLLNIKNNFSTIFTDEKKSRIIVDKVLNDELYDAKRLSNEIVIKNFLYNYELAVNVKMKLSLKNVILEELERKVHDLNKDIDNIIHVPQHDRSDYVKFLSQVKNRFFDHNSYQDIDIKEILLEKIETLKSIGYTVNQNISEMNVLGRKYTLYKIFVNIFSNIIEHSTEKTVNIVSEEKIGFFVIKIRNFGSFISAENYDVIFSKNYTSKPFNLKLCGSGLYDTKQSILQIGGDITVESYCGSNLSDSWTEFVLKIPIQNYGKISSQSEHIANNGDVSPKIRHIDVEQNKEYEHIVVVIDDEPHIYEEWKTLNDKCLFFVFSHFDEFFNAVDNDIIVVNKVHLIITDYYFDKVKPGMTVFSNGSLETLNDIYDYKGLLVLATNGSFEDSVHFDAVIEKYPQKIKLLLQNLNKI